MFLTISKKNIFVWLGVCAMILICSLGMTNPTVASVYTSKNIRKLPVYNVNTTDKVVALTFDAAWGADKTQNILDILNKYSASATFFLVGFWVDDYPEMVTKIDEMGCDIGNHSKNHLKMSVLSKSEINEELNYVNNKVKAITGKEPKFFRAPFGDYNNNLIQSVEDKNMQAIQWNIDSLDWKGISAVEIVGRVTKNIKNGSIILFHNNSDNILEALPLVLTNLSNQGYRFVKLSELVYCENYYIDNNGEQHRNK